MSGKKVEILIIFILIFSAVAVAADNDANTEAEGGMMAKPDTAVKEPELLSPLTAKTFYDIGYELYTDKQADSFSAKQAIIFFNAAINLDSKAGYVLPDIINIAWQYPDQNLVDVVQLVLDEYVDFSSDLEVTSKAVGYLLERLDSREDRQQLLENLLYKFQQKNSIFASDIATQLGLLTAETADAEIAQRCLMGAFQYNMFNRLAFAKLAELAETKGQQLPDIVYLQNLRFAVRANPLDFTSALRFAQYAQALGLYEPAAAAYKYCNDLSNYLAGPNSIGLDIYRPWMLNCYNLRQFDQCRMILQKIRDKGIFDIQAEAIALAAAKFSGNEQDYKAILEGIEARSNKILSGKSKSFSSELVDFTWFYSFVADANSEKILAWATKAYDAEPNTLDAASLFAYALVINNQAELAGPVLEKIDTSTQTAGLAKAIILAEKQDSNSAMELLNKVVDSMPGSFEAQKARAKLKELGSEHRSLIDSNALITALQNDFGQTFFSRFVEPEKMVSLKFNMKGTSFSYGSEIAGNLVIANNYSEPMIICPDAMIKGNVRVDAQINGDLTAKIPALVVKTVRPSYEIKPGDALFVPLRLETGKVKSILDSHPQAQLNLEFTAYIDPQTDSSGRIKSPFNIKPAKTVVTRRKLNLDTHYLQQRLDAIKRGHQGQKAMSAQLFAGLLTEQQKFKQTGPAYGFIYVEPQLLSSALAKCLSENDWILKVQAIDAMLKIKLDYRLTEVVSEELDNPNWPVRLMAVYILNKNGDEKFKPVLAWMAKNDPHPMVKGLAAILSDKFEPALPAQSKVEGGNSNRADANDINLQIKTKAADTNDVNLSPVDSNTQK
ncbi:MAG: HEAT repeat domain-containing protein [Sedimentisphaerales bacterium]